MCIVHGQFVTNPQVSGSHVSCLGSALRRARSYNSCERILCLLEVELYIPMAWAAEKDRVYVIKTRWDQWQRNAVIEWRTERLEGTDVLKAGVRYKKTATADKPRDAFVQMQCCGWPKNTPLPDMCYYVKFDSSVTKGYA